MAYYPSAAIRSRVSALNRSKERLDATRAELLSFPIFGYRIRPAPGSTFTIHDRHGRHIGRLMPDGRFQRSTVKGAAELAPGFAVALQMLAAQVDEATADYLPAVAIT